MRDDMLQRLAELHLWCNTLRLNLRSHTDVIEESDTVKTYTSPLRHRGYGTPWGSGSVHNTEALRSRGQCDTGPRLWGFAWHTLNAKTGAL